ncbi:heterokaryon incompatibility protein-domain-containing protein [Xylaria sp. FL0043]|nr:heterokaryon incompatibility protein-domain-containing protein [Xylaria sp. FL0043]
MPRQLPEPHSCMYCEGLGFNAASRPSSADQKLDQWKRFASSRALKLLEETSGLKEHLERQLRSIEVLCTVDWRQIQDYAAKGCLFYSYIEEKTAHNNISEPRDLLGIKEFSDLLYLSSENRDGLEDERRFFICIEHTSISEFRFRYFVHPHQVFHLIHFKRDASKFISDDWVKIDPFRMVREGPRRRDEPSGIPSKINYEPGSDDLLAFLSQQCEQIIGYSVADAQNRTCFVPTRLLTFDRTDCKAHVRVVEARMLQQDDTKRHLDLAFAALSYCWGGQQKLKLSTTSKEALMAGIAFSSLPRTFQDAVVVASKMGLSYLWVDALCIMQDDEEDKERELAVMAKVYQNATFTIVASRANSVEEGFLGPRLPFEDSCRIPFRLRVRYSKGSSETDTETEEANLYSSAVCFPKMDMITSDDEGLEPVDPVFTRAWCFQEIALSGTVIEFGVLVTRIRHVYSLSGKLAVNYALDGWHNDWRKTNVIVTHEVLQSTKNAEGNVVGLWGSVVENYSPLALSLPEDRLPALSALAETFSPYFDGNDISYLAGLWRDTMPQALFWTVNVMEPNRDGRPHRDARMHAPTWSWASVTSGVKHVLVPLLIPQGDIFKTDLGFDILGYNPQLVLPKVKFGAVSRGELRVRGRLRPVTLTLDDPYYHRYDHNITMQSSLMDGVDYSAHRERSVRVFTGDGHHSTTRGLHRLEYDHPQAAYRDHILCAHVYLDRREADVSAMIAESEGLYLLPIVSGPSEERELHIDELCWGFRMPELRSIFGLLLVKNVDGTYSRAGVFQFSNKDSGSILDSQVLELEDSGALYEDQHRWVQGGELAEFTMI